ncbi:MAG TPA: hypothetical protein VF624_06280 [Tepidisphaeraceae bacterium]|jgi:uncharacterized protein Yka (UPF0111/DUF47 family)
MKPTLTELRELDAKLELRLQQLSRAEANLRGLYDSLRGQVQAAYPALQELQQVLPVAQEVAMRTLSNVAHTDRLGEKADGLVAAARAEIDSLVEAARRQMTDELQAAVAAAAANAPAFDHEKAARPEIEALTTWFGGELREAMRVQREMLLDQLATLSAEATMRIEPLLSDLAQKRVLADEHVRGVVVAAEKSIQTRADQMARGIDAMAGALDERLSQRLAVLCRRGEDVAGNAIERFQDVADAAVAAAEQTLAAGEQRLADRAAALQQRASRQVADAAAELSNQVQRLEAHADSMTRHLSDRLTAQTEHLIDQLRLKLQHEIAAAGGPSVPRPRATAPRAPLQVDLFVNRAVRPTDTAAAA